MLQGQGDVDVAGGVWAVGGAQAQVCAQEAARAGLAAVFQGQGHVTIRQAECEAADTWAAQQVAVVAPAQACTGLGVPVVACWVSGLGLRHALLGGQELVALVGGQVGAGTGLGQQLCSTGKVTRASQGHGVGKSSSQVVGGQQQGTFKVLGSFGVLALCVEPFTQVSQPVGLVLALGYVGQQLFQGVLACLWATCV